MKTVTKKKVTLMLDERVYAGLRARVGERGVGAFLSELARPHVLVDDLEAGYKAMVKDSLHAREAQEWAFGYRGDAV
jgi:hypothetical protein